MVSVNETSGAHHTADCMTEALKKREERCKILAGLAMERARMREHRSDYPETINDLQWLCELSPRRTTLTKDQIYTRKQGHERSASCTASKIMLSCTNLRWDTDSSALFLECSRSHLRKRFSEYRLWVTWKRFCCLPIAIVANLGKHVILVFETA